MGWREYSIRLFNELRQQITEIVVIKNIERLLYHPSDLNTYNEYYYSRLSSWSERSFKMDWHFGMEPCVMWSESFPLCFSFNPWRPPCTFMRVWTYSRGRHSFLSPPVILSSLKFKTPHQFCESSSLPLTCCSTRRQINMQLIGHSAPTRVGSNFNIFLWTNA